MAAPAPGQWELPPAPPPERKALHLRFRHHCWPVLLPLLPLWVCLEQLPLALQEQPLLLLLHLAVCQGWGW